MTESLLDGDKTEEITIDPNKKYLEELVGPGKKYADQEALAKAYAHADSMIKIKNAREDELRKDYLKVREELMAKAKLEDLVNQLQTKQQQSPNSDTQQQKENTPQPIDIDKILTEKLTAYELANKQRENQRIVKERLTQRFGTNYQNTVKQQIQELDITEEQFNQMAQNNPKLLFKTLDLDAKPEQFNAPPRTMNRSDSFSAPNRQQKKTWSYYQELKKSDPVAYRSPKITNEMQQSYQQLGAEFEDGDFRQYGDGA